MQNDNDKFYNDPNVTRLVQKERQLIGKLLKKGDIPSIRKIRDNKPIAQIEILHHAKESDAYFNDIDAKCYTWAQIQELTDVRKSFGLHTLSVIVYYPAGTILPPTQLIN